MKEKPYIAYIKRLCAIERKRMEGRLVRSYKRLRERLVRWLQSHGIGLEDSEDLSQKVWAELLVAVRSRQFREWTDAIVYHKASQRILDHFRRRRNRERLLRKRKGEIVGLSPMRRFASDNETDFEPEIVGYEPDIDTGILVRKLLAELPCDERAVIESVYLEGCTVEETAEHLKTSVSTTKRLQSRALSWMRSRVA